MEFTHFLTTYVKLRKEKRPLLGDEIEMVNIFKTKGIGQKYAKEVRKNFNEEEIRHIAGFMNINFGSYSHNFKEFPHQLVPLVGHLILQERKKIELS